MAGYDRREDAWRRVRLSRRTVDEIGEKEGIWYESPEEVAEKLVCAQERRVLMAWVTRQMKRRLNARERRCVELYYLESRSFREIAGDLGITKSTAERTLRAAIAKLRAARDATPRRG